MSEHESPTTENLGSAEEAPTAPKEVEAGTVTDATEESPVVTNEQEPPPAPSPSAEEESAKPESEGPPEVAPVVTNEEPPAPAESEKIESVPVVEEAPVVTNEEPPAPAESEKTESVPVVEEAPVVTNEEPPAPTESEKTESVPAVEEAHTNEEEPPPAKEIESAPEEAPVIANSHEPAKTESEVVTPAPRTILNEREPPRTESVGAAELTRMANFGFKTYKNLVRGKPKGPLLPDAYLKFADKLYNFEFRSDDIMVMAFPRSGTTWVAEIVWALTNIDQLHLMDELGVRDRALWIEKDAVFPGDLEDGTNSEIQKFKELYPGENPEEGVVLKLAAAEKSPRHFFTHLPPQFHNPEMLSTCKVIYVARNPKDVCLSWYNFICNLEVENQKQFEGEFAEFVEGFKAGYILYSPYWEHIRQAWQQRHHRNLHFLFYEDLKTDIMGELRRLSSFLRLGLGDDQLKKVSELTSFQIMKGREDKLPIVKELQTSFFHKGEIGSWDGTASPLVDARMVAWINENLQGTDIKFTFN